LGKTKVNQKQTIPVISSQNKFELLNEDINNSSGHLEHNHESFEVNSIHSTHTSHEQPHSAPNPDLHVETTSPNKQTPRQSNNDENNQAKKSNSDSPVVLIGDSIVKNINPKKISKKNVKSIPTNSTPSHVIIHVGTNNLPINTADECVKNIEDLAHSAKARFPGSRIALSSIIGRHDIDITSKILEVNKSLKVLRTKHGYAFIDNQNIDKSCLNGSNLHLNAKGSAYLAVNFIKFIRPNDAHDQNQRGKDFRPSVHQQHLMEKLVRLLQKDLLEPSKHDPMQNYYKDQGKSINSLNNLKGMKLASLNINSITKHIDELRILMKDKPLDLIAINESKTDDTVLDREIHIIGYNMIRKDHNRNGGGVIIYLRDTISFSERNDLTSNSLEMICLEIKKPHNKSFLVCTCLV
jgi:hypothetical protein